MIYYTKENQQDWSVCFKDTKGKEQTLEAGMLKEKAENLAHSMETDVNDFQWG